MPISPSSSRIPDLVPSALMLSHAGAQCCSIPMVTLALSSAFSNAWVTSHLDGCLSTFLITQFSVSFERVLFFVFFSLFISKRVTLYHAIPALLSTLFWESQPYLHGLMTLASAPASLNSTTGTNYKYLEFKWPQGECLPIICPTCSLALP